MAHGRRRWPSSALSYRLWFRASRANARTTAHFRDVGEQVEKLLDSMTAHEAKRREQEAELAKLESEHRETVDWVIREYKARKGTDDSQDDEQGQST